MCVVILLRFSAGPIEFKGFGFEFRGAAGQVVFWISASWLLLLLLGYFGCSNPSYTGMNLPLIFVQKFLFLCGDEFLCNACKATKSPL